MASVLPIADNVLELSPFHIATSTIEQMEQLRTTIEGFCPPEARVHLTYDGRCRIHVDVRSVEEVMAVETALGRFGAGHIGAVQRVTVPGKAFIRRISATID